MAYPITCKHRFASVKHQNMAYPLTNCGLAPANEPLHLIAQRSCLFGRKPVYLAEVPFCKRLRKSPHLAPEQNPNGTNLCNWLHRWRISSPAPQQITVFHVEHPSVATLKPVYLADLPL